MRQTQTGRHLQDRGSHLRSAIRCHAVVADRRHGSRTRKAAKPADARHRHDAGGVLRPNRTFSDQGKVLVPGLTLGVLGQDYVPAEGDGTDIDSTYAAQVKDAFQRSGIVHLVAVSGGHLAVAAAFVRSVCSFFLLPQRFTALLVAMSYIILSACVFPSIRIPRAFDGIVRRGMPLHRQTRPGDGVVELVHIGYADGMPAHVARLRVRPVLRRGARHRAVRRHPQRMELEPVLPRFVAEALSMTIAAQVFTLPIQVLIEPELPVFSIPANLMVAPFVGFATLAGLAVLPFSMADSVARPATGPCGLLGHRGHGTDRP